MSYSKWFRYFIMISLFGMIFFGTVLYENAVEGASGNKHHMLEDFLAKTLTIQTTHALALSIVSLLMTIGLQLTMSSIAWLTVHLSCAGFMCLIVGVLHLCGAAFCLKN